MENRASYAHFTELVNMNRKESTTIHGRMGARAKLAAARWQQREMRWERRVPAGGEEVQIVFPRPLLCLNQPEPKA
jgi:hypothetical protein